MGKFSKIKVKAPATTANVGSSFDCLGIAAELFNYITLELSEEDHYFYNSQVSKDHAFIFNIIDKFFEFEGKVRPKFKVLIDNDIPLSRGLGSSSAAIASTLVAVNALCFDEKYSLDELLSFAFRFEKHPDNLSPSFMGGMVISAINVDRVSYYKFENFVDSFIDKKLLFFVPDYFIDTELSRDLLLKTSAYLSHREYIKGMNDSTLNIIAFAKGDFSALRKSMDDQVWHHQQRKSTIRFMDEIFKVAMENKAYGVAISGSGPTLVMVADEQNAEMIKKAIFEITDGKFYDLRAAEKGVEILWKK
ncbi:MAG: homoserine kinase [bacterium]|nr:homoserine kinase [bacterium]